MKWFTVLFLVLGTFGNSAFANVQTALREIEIVYATVNEADLVDYNYFLNFSRELPTVKQQLTDSESCQDQADFVPVKATEIVGMIHDEVSEGMRRAFEATDSYSDQLNALHKASDSLIQALKNRSIRVCTVMSYPSYSDGHETRFVKISGRLAFAFEVGSPD